MLLESEWFHSVCCPRSLWSINFTFSLIFPKLSKGEVHLFIWRAANNLLMIETSCGHVNMVFYVALNPVFCGVKALPKMSVSYGCIRQRFPHHSRASPTQDCEEGRTFLGTWASSFRVFPGYPLGRPSAKSGLQWAGTCQGRAWASPCRVEAVLAVSIFL